MTIKKFFKWAIPNTVFASVWVLSIQFDLSGFLVLAKGLTWLAMIISLLLFAVSVKDMQKFLDSAFSGTPLGKVLDVSYDTTMVIYLAYFGFGGYAFIYLLHAIVTHIAIQATKETKCGKK